MKHQETKGYEGFIMCITYPEALKKPLELIIRDHNKIKFEKRKEKVRLSVKSIRNLRRNLVKILL
jgi:tripeptide aminopeptidase